MKSLLYDLKDIEVRQIDHACRSALAVLLALLAMHLWLPDQGEWTILGAICIMQAASVQERFLSRVAIVLLVTGISLVSQILFYWMQDSIVFATVFLVLATFVYIWLADQNMTWGIVAVFAFLMPIFMFGIPVQSGEFGLRLLAIALAAPCILMSYAIWWPHRLDKNLPYRFINSLRLMGNFHQALANYYVEHKAEKLCTLHQLRTRILTNLDALQTTITVLKSTPQLYWRQQFEKLELCYSACASISSRRFDIDLTNSQLCQEMAKLHQAIAHTLAQKKSRRAILPTPSTADELLKRQITNLTQLLNDLNFADIQRSRC